MDGTLVFSLDLFHMSDICYPMIMLLSAIGWGVAAREHWTQRCAPNIRSFDPGTYGTLSKIVVARNDHWFLEPAIF